MKRLQHLSLKATQNTEAGWQELAKLPNLQQAAFTDAQDKCMEKAVRALAGSQSVRTIWFYSNCAHLDAFRNHPSLETLWLTDSKPATRASKSSSR